MIVLYGIMLLSLTYLLCTLYLAGVKAYQRHKAYKTNWIIYNTTAEFTVNHYKIWFYVVVLLCSIHLTRVLS